MGTAAGMAAFLNEHVNAQLKRILNAWARFLSSGDSTYVLNDDASRGWFGADARKAMPNFEREFVCDPTLPHRGFRSWDHFFTRELRPGVRPVASPEDDVTAVLDRTHAGERRNGPALRRGKGVFTPATLPSTRASLRSRASGLTISAGRARGTAAR
jgi:Phophatidylserine decarboxylase